MITRKQNMIGVGFLHVEIMAILIDRSFLCICLIHYTLSQDYAQAFRIMTRHDAR